MKSAFCTKRYFTLSKGGAKSGDLLVCMYPPRRLHAKCLDVKYDHRPTLSFPPCADFTSCLFRDHSKYRPDGTVSVLTKGDSNKVGGYSAVVSLPPFFLLCYHMEVERSDVNIHFAQMRIPYTCALPCQHYLSLSIVARGPWYSFPLLPSPDD